MGLRSITGLKAPEGAEATILAGPRALYPPKWRIKGKVENGMEIVTLELQRDMYIGRMENQLEMESKLHASWVCVGICMVWAFYPLMQILMEKEWKNERWDHTRAGCGDCRGPLHGHFSLAPSNNRLLTLCG